MRKIHKIIVDTNFLIDAVRFKVDLNSIDDLIPSSRLIMPKAVEDELLKMKNRHARAACKLVKLLGLEAVENPSDVKNTDKTIIALAKEIMASAVATNDVELRKRLKTLGIKTIYLRARKHLEIS